MQKNRLNRLEFLKNEPVGFSFGFISLKLKKSNRTEPKPKKPSKKPSQTGKTEPNRKNDFCSKITKPNRTETGWFELISVFFFKNKIKYFFLNKNQTKLKIITSSNYSNTPYHRRRYGKG
jgi:hypothetical protein